MIQTIIIKYNQSIDRLPEDSCICLNLLDMLNMDTKEKINASDYLVESYQDGNVTRAFKFKYVDLFKTTINMSSNNKLNWLKTEIDYQGIEWYTYCVIIRANDIKKDLLQGKILKVKKYMISELLNDMDDINTLSIQKCIDGDYWIKVDSLTVGKYIQERYGE